MTLILPSRATRQPQQAVRIDWSNPITRALSFAWVASAPDVNLVTGRPATTQGAAPAKLPYIDRLGRKFIGSGSIDFGNAPETNFGGASQQTVLTEVLMDATANGYILGRVQSTWDYFIDVASGPQQFHYGAGGDAGGVAAPATSAPSGLAPFQGRPVPIVGTYDKVSSKIYIDGTLRNTKANTGSFATGADPFAIGARGGGGQASVTGIYIGLVLVFRRVLSDSEIASLAANPSQLFAAPQRRLMVAAASAPAGNAYALPAAQGSYTITGNAAGLRAARRLTASAGGYALAGNAAALKVARRMAAVAGAYSITGSAAGLIKGTAPSALQAAGGSYALAGKPVALRVARRLQAAPGAYAITGFAVADRVMPVVTISVRFDTLPRNFNLKTIHFSN